jgi:hypothetical protein
MFSTSLPLTSFAGDTLGLQQMLSAGSYPWNTKFCVYFSETGNHVRERTSEDNFYCRLIGRMEK